VLSILAISAVDVHAAVTDAETARELVPFVAVPLGSCGRRRDDERKRHSERKPTLGFHVRSVYFKKAGSRFEPWIVAWRGSSSTLPRPEVLEVVSVVFVALEARCPTLLEADALHERVEVGFAWILHVVLRWAMARLASVIGNRVEVLVRCAHERLLVARVTRRWS